MGKYFSKDTENVLIKVLNNAVASRMQDKCKYLQITISKIRQFPKTEEKKTSEKSAWKDIQCPSVLACVPRENDTLTNLLKII